VKTSQETKTGVLRPWL